ncbi:CopG family transcriptional regulator [Exiguobacterium sp. AM39-5BH]|uniref:CopG family transcriptional regulator n=1 Tax=Exiguobacterium sp. AM39-5BH TaxID=2292355 RepID=UPI000FE21E7C|nr:CopG family transcriptional regulator [Exiguobacterium sp. AM39-5BH]RHB46699.1 CopG family transcriptional regulator [Exiguobacterium sp. AM39-5BH]
MSNAKKRLSLTIDADLDQIITERAKQIGIPKSALVTFATSLFLNQLRAEEVLSGDTNAIYQVIRKDYELLTSVDNLDK